MNRKTHFATELETLRSLCDASIPRQERLKRMQTLSPRDFTEPEHQVAFESIRALLSSGEVSVARLNVHLNNRGFPCTQVEKYFQPAPDGTIQPSLQNKVTP
jgi:hypothetical protein